MLGKVAFINISVEDGVKAAIFTSWFPPRENQLFKKEEGHVGIVLFFPLATQSPFTKFC